MSTTKWGHVIPDVSLPTEIWVVIRFSGNKDIIGSQMLDRAFFSKDAAEARAARMQKRHHWIWRAVRADAHIEEMKKQIRRELEERGIPTR